jgi:dTDP-4-dehydrorhamnose reductase
LLLKHVLILGNGFLGSHIGNELKNRKIPFSVTNFTNIDGKFFIDVRNASSIEKVVSDVSPDLIINCVAIGTIDYLESNPEIAFSLNSDGAKNIATVAKKFQIKLIHISTDSIFDGKSGNYLESDTPNPINIYAQSKVKAEEFVRNITDNHVIIRTNFYGYDSRGNWFFNWVYEQFTHNQKIFGFDDVRFNPLEVSNLSKIILDISLIDFTGTINLGSTETISKYQFIVKVAEIFGFNKNMIIEGTYDKYANAIAKRPLNTSLDISKSLKLLNPKIMSYEKSLQKIKERQND